MQAFSFILGGLEASVKQLYDGMYRVIIPEQMNKIQKQLTLRAERKIDLFQDQDPMVMEYAEKYGSELVDRKKVDISKNTEKKQGRLVDFETIKHENVREIGAEWLSYQALEQLKVAEFLKGLGWEEEVDFCPDVLYA